MNLKFYFSFIFSYLIINALNITKCQDFTFQCDTYIGPKVCFLMNAPNRLFEIKASTGENHLHFILKSNPVVFYFSTDNNVHFNHTLNGYQIENILPKCKNNILGFQDCTDLKMNKNEFSVFRSLSNYGIKIYKQYFGYSFENRSLTFIDDNNYHEHYNFSDLAGCFDYLKNNLCFDYKTNFNQASINYFLKDFEKISFDKKNFLLELKIENKSLSTNLTILNKSWNASLSANKEKDCIPLRVKGFKICYIFKIDKSQAHLISYAKYDTCIEDNNNCYNQCLEDDDVDCEESCLDNEEMNECITTMIQSDMKINLKKKELKTTIKYQNIAIYDYVLKVSENMYCYPLINDISFCGVFKIKSSGAFLSFFFNS